MIGSQGWIQRKYRGVRHLAVLLLALMLITPGLGAQAQAQTADGAVATYIVVLSDPPLASYRGGIAGLSPTNPRTLGQIKLDAASPASRAYRDYLRQQQALAISTIESALGHPLQVGFRYDAAINGFAARLTGAEAGKVSALPGIRRVQRDYSRQLTTDNGPTWIGAPGIWDGTRTGGLGATKGEGIVIGVIDTGINHDHPSFADPGPVDGYNYPERATHLGLCAPRNPVLCNDKLIGMYDFTGSGPEDNNGHGSHTAGTAGGNLVDARLLAPTITIASRISGVAPHANIVSYKACETTPVGECLISALLAAINAATLDAVDVVNYSIGGASSDPWSDLDAQAFLGARDAGIFVATSAGNSGPAPATIGSPADAPWVMSVGATTHDRKFVNRLVNMTGGGSTPPANMIGKSISGSYGPARIVYAGAAPYNNPLCTPFAAGTFNGEIVVCDRGENGRVEKSQNVKNAGGGGFVLANDQASGSSLVGDAHAVPGVHISYADGVKLKGWLSKGTGQKATIAGTTRHVSPTNGDIMASFSSRGQNPATADLVKPDLAAPGVDIMAAFNSSTPAGPNPEYGIISGTSMASPHAAGAAALLRALRPGWTPAEVQSALMTTALTSGVRKENGVTPADPFDMGAGRVNLNLAARAGLVLDEQEPNYSSADPKAGGKPRTLNLPSMSNGSCAQRCGWTRTLRNTTGTAVSWRASVVVPSGMRVAVSPSSFSIAPGATQRVVVTADVTGLPVGQWRFAQLVLTPSVSSIPPAKLPIAVRKADTQSGVDTRTVLHFHGNTGGHDDMEQETTCTGQGPADIVACDGPFLLPSASLSPSPAARWTVPENLFDGTGARNIYDPNWIWVLSKPVVLAGPMTVEFWASCGGCGGPAGFTADWTVRLWVDGTKVHEEQLQATPLLPHQPQKLTVTTRLPLIKASSSVVLHVDPYYVDSNVNSTIYYDSAEPCPGAAGEEPCDSLVRMPVDTKAPTVTAPAHTIGVKQSDGNVRVQVKWTASDDLSGVERNELQLSTNGGTFRTVSLPVPTATSHVLNLAPGNSYRFRVRATDRAGNTSAFQTGPSFVVSAASSTSGVMER